MSAVQFYGYVGAPPGRNYAMRDPHWLLGRNGEGMTAIVKGDEEFVRKIASLLNLDLDPTWSIEREEEKRTAHQSSQG